MNNKYDNEERIRKWDLIFLVKAAMASTTSKDPSTKIGASIKCSKNRVVSEGYNGLPQGMYDDPKILNNRDLKYRQILHAEENAILSAGRNLDGMTIYTYPIPPCLKCTSVLIQAGITRVVSVYNEIPRWEEEVKKAERHLKELGIETKFYKQSEVKEEIIRRTNSILGIEDDSIDHKGHNEHNCEDIDE